ncbi:MULTISPECIES: GNAT family N-acetyltransferase [unclassified Streptosporangium]|uniref:GNAT family N-acetyltransferase n=1 Tax=unclassified Streptosporangium TaxID=2632669 RepID=UPI002E2C3CDA|nr:MULTISPECIES: GNAT family N-acetyltransferase [unclassified Streptosporangium]
MTDQVTTQRWDGNGAAVQLDAILAAYEEVYAEPPYLEGPRDVADFIDRFHRQTERQGFRLAVARDGTEVVGFTFGYRLPPDTQWWRGLLRPASKEFTRETGNRTFVIIELAVRKPWRQRGIARKLHFDLIEGLEVERVTLTMRPEPEAKPAQFAYASWGYQMVGQSRPWDEAPLYNSMVLNLKVANP